MHEALFLFASKMALPVFQKERTNRERELLFVSIYAVLPVFGAFLPGAKVEKSEENEKRKCVPA